MAGYLPAVHAHLFPPAGVGARDRRERDGALRGRHDRGEVASATAIAEFGLPWQVARLGCRAEYLFRAEPPRNGREAGEGQDFDLQQYMHLHALNRGILLTPFHNMALMCPATTENDVDQHTAAFRDAVKALLAD